PLSPFTSRSRIRLRFGRQAWRFLPVLVRWPKLPIDNRPWARNLFLAEHGCSKGIGSLIHRGRHKIKRRDADNHSPPLPVESLNVPTHTSVTRQGSLRSPVKLNHADPRSCLDPDGKSARDNHVDSDRVASHDRSVVETTGLGVKRTAGIIIKRHIIRNQKHDRTVANGPGLAQPPDFVELVIANVDDPLGTERKIRNSTLHRHPNRPWHGS